ncbi:isochorismatase family cysteine hydrolase [Eubacterium sp. 1001713B170207_170306_E7]|uniref:cysteine hydrolase family protein n=1 Tax=Eubacterium sp. 1001713B170207_170306_E7 TaxID=2787097 RepID=UPI0018991ABA|nr:isochorismatase family cysteine hydrolase [Eubacterium sp. 1001713B170207_170306_E7]
MDQALILIDYTYDFVAPDGKLTAGAPAQAIDDNLAAAVSETLEAGGMVFVVNDLHLENDETHPETRLFPPHNLLGSPGRAVYGKTAERLRSYQALENRQVFYMDKLRYSAFAGTALDILLRQNQIWNLELAGVCTDICVLHTAISAYNLGYAVTVHRNRVASFNAEGHKWALEHFKSSLGFTVV